jgi:hypothetical protein
MHACMYVCMYVCLYICMHVCMSVYLHACIHVCMHVCMYVCMCVCQCTDSRLISDDWQCGGQCCRTCTPSVPPRASFLILPPCEDDASGSQNSVWAALSAARRFCAHEKALPALPRSLFAWAQIQHIIVTFGSSYPTAEKALSPSCLSSQVGGAS